MTKTTIDYIVTWQERQDVKGHPGATEWKNGSIKLATELEARQFFKDVRRRHDYAKLHKVTDELLDESE